MRRGVGGAWVRLLDSAGLRRTMRAPAVRRVRASAAFAAADLRRRWVLSRLRAFAARERYDAIRTLGLLVGHTKSGGTLLGALLDAHADTAFADEVDVVAYVEAGFSPRQVYYLLEKAARREAMKGNVTARRLEPYSFAVPGQSQGRSTTLRLVGASKAGITTQRLGADPTLPSTLQRWLGDVDLRFVHVVRNPFDPMSVMMLRGRRTFEGAFERYFANCAILKDLYDRLPSSMITLVRYEDMVADPAGELARVCGHLGLAAHDGYLAACAAAIHERVPERTRVSWDERAVDRVRAEMARYAFLDGYSFALPGDAG